LLARILLLSDSGRGVRKASVRNGQPLRLCQKFLHNLAVHIGEPETSSLMFEG